MGDHSGNPVKAGGERGVPWGSGDGEGALQVDVGWGELSEKKQDPPQYRVCMGEAFRVVLALCQGEELLPEITCRLELPSRPIKFGQSR
jgi:hypothetical protein